MNEEQWGVLSVDPETKEAGVEFCATESEARACRAKWYSNQTTRLVKRTVTYSEWETV